MAWNNNNGNWQGGGGNNPFGGGRGPNDIDDAFRKGQERLKGMFGGGGKRTIWLILAGLLVVWLLTGFYTVQTSQQGVVLQFGKWVRTETPGLKWHIPYPVETVLLPNVTQENRIDIGFRAADNDRRGSAQRRVLEESLMLTGDENIVDIAFTVFWRVEDAGKFLFNVREQEATIKAVAESAMRDIIGRTPIQFALTDGRLTIEEEAVLQVQSVLNEYDAGVSITQVKMERADPPAQVIDDFRDVQAAEADRERFVNQGEAYRNQVVPEARGQSAQIRQAAQAYKEQVIARANGEAQRFIEVYEQYRLAPDVTRKRLYLESMQEILSGMNKVLIDENAGTGVLPYLPLPELNNKQGGDK